MPVTYTDCDPSQKLSQEQINALSTIQKTIEARIVYNKNLLNFISDPENKSEIDLLMNNLFPTLTVSVLEQKDFFVETTKLVVESYEQHMEDLKTCKTMEDFDRLYLNFRFELAMDQHAASVAKEEMVKHLKTVSKKQKKQSCKTSFNLFKDMKLLEEPYYIGFYNELKPLVSKHAYLFERCYEFKFAKDGSYNCVWHTTLSQLGEKFHEQVQIELVELENTHLKFLKNFGSQHLDKEFHVSFNKLREYSRKINTLKAYDAVDPHQTNDVNSALAILKHFQWFSLVVFQRTEIKKLLCLFKAKRVSLVTPSSHSIQPKGIEQENPENPTAIVTAPDVTLEKEQSFEELNEPVAKVSVNPTVEIKQIAEGSELVTKVSVHTTAVRKKIEISEPLVESVKINSALKFIVNLNLKDSECLLNWLKKPPHMQVELTKLESLIKKLNGKIDTSGGGSHHTIVFKHSLAFIDAFNITKCTLVKSHGSKASRFLPSYAIQTFMCTLQKMGVTKSILSAYANAYKNANAQDKNVLLRNAQMLLDAKMLLLLGVYKSKKGFCQSLRKLDLTEQGKKPTLAPGTQNLIRRVFSFLD